MSGTESANGVAGTPGAEAIRLALYNSSVASISDAIDQLCGRHGFMSHDMKPLFKTKLVGKAATATLRTHLQSDKRAYPNLALQLLDEAEPGSVLVYVVEHGLNIAAMGNLMAATAKARGLSGAVIDGGVRDSDEIIRLGFSLFSRSISPTSILGRRVCVEKQIPVLCAGVWVRPGDYIVGDSDGVVVVPAENVLEVVELVAQFDETERRMIPYIEETHSMQAALDKFKRY